MPLVSGIFYMGLDFRMIKKFTMLTVKAAVGMLPLSVKDSLKKNARLTEFYSRSLQRSGLFFGFPSPKKLQALYTKRLNRQKTELDKFCASTQVCNVFISGGSINAILQSIQSFENGFLSVQTFFLEESVFSQVDKSSFQDSNIAPFSAHPASDEIPVLLIRAGESANTKLLVQALTKYNGIPKDRLFYFDWHYQDKAGKPTDAQLLPDWNPDLQLSTGYIKTAIWLYNPSYWFSRFPLRNEFYAWVAEIAITNNSAISHIPYSILTALGDYAKDKIDLDKLANPVSSKAAGLSDHTKRVVSLMWPLHSQPLISLVIPTYNGKSLVQACINSILDKTTYKNFEILLVDNNSDDPASLKYFEELDAHPKIRLLKYPFPFNYSAINNFAVEQAEGEVIGLINNDIEIITPEWLEYMAGHAMRPEIGCVGAKLLYADGRIQHAGVVMGYGGGAGHAHKYFPRYHPGYLKRLVATQNYSAVTAACLLVKKELWHKVGGLDEQNLKVAFNDVDFCLRILETGVRNIYCAEAEMFHYESISRGLDIAPEKALRFKQELDYLQEKWAKYIEHDPAYNPNLTLRRENFSIKSEQEVGAI